MKEGISRRRFIASTSAAGLALSFPHSATAEDTAKPVSLGGKPACTTSFPTWPIFDQREEEALLSTLKSAQWFRGSGKKVNQFETEFAKILGGKHCVGTSSGTTALISGLNALGVGAGDEVILPPYTFVACVNAILMLGAVPVFVDSDIETFQIDAKKLEASITEHTAAIMAVHLGGNAADMDTIVAIGKKHKIPVIEDACQAHLGEWRGKKLGTLGSLGCFSFQASKNLTAGEGGAIITDDEALAERCFAAHNNSRPRKVVGTNPSLMRGANLRMSEFHASLLLSQMERLPDQAKTRDENGAYLADLLGKIPGITPAKQYEGCTRNAYHLFMFRYNPAEFANMPRFRFLSLLAAEGVRASAGYSQLNKEPFILETLQSRGFKRSFSKDRLDRWIEQNKLPSNDKLCQEAIWFSQNILLANRDAMDQIDEAIRKIQLHAGALSKS